jgi:dTDP-4-dehydrorhamnose reductase
MRRLLVTGGSGYLGRELVGLAREAGWEVVATSFSQPGRRVDVRDEDAVRRLVTEVDPDAVVHTAYRQDGPDARAVTVDGARHVAAAARAAGARLVHLSTDVVFDGRAGRPYREHDPPTPVTAYGAAKADAERDVAEAHPEALLIRTSLIYGGATPSKHEDAARDPSATFYEDEIRCPVQVGDLAAALLELVESDAAGPLHVAGADAVSRADFAELVTGAAVRRAPAPPDRPLDCSLDSSRARAMIDTRLRGVREVLG